MIVGIGDNCIDFYLPPVNLQFVGGNIVNVVTNLRKHGHASAYIGTVGDDERGNQIISSLRERGINTKYISQVEGESGITVIEIENGEYLIRSEQYGVSNMIHIDDEILSFLKENADIIHLSLTGKALELIPVLHQLSTPLSCDISTQYELHDAAFWQRLFPYVDYVFLSAGSAAPPEKVERMIREIAGFGTTYVVATRGSKGCFAYWRGKVSSHDSLLATSDVVDPLGAGDAFIAGFLYSVMEQEKGMDAHLLRASKWAAEACSHYGA